MIRGRGWIAGALVAISAALMAAPARAEIRLPATREVTLPNGARLILAEKHDVPLIAAIAYLRGGALTDPAGKEGLATLTAEMLHRGAGKRSAQALASAVDGVGAELTVGAGYEDWWVSAEFLSRDQKLMVELLSDILRRPSFPDTEFVKAKQQSIDAIRSDKDNPYNVVTDYGRAYFFDGNPYGRPLEGDEATVGSITREDLLAAYRSNFGGDRLILSVVGDFDGRKMESALREAFADWHKASGAIPAPPAPQRRQGRKILLVDKPDATQTYFWIGNLGMARTDPDRAAADVANTHFGGRFTSLLNSALRIRTGLTYGARCLMPRYAVPGYVAIVSYTKTESTQRAIDLALETLGTFRATGLDSAALSSSKGYIAGLYPTGLETEDQIAGRLAELSLYDLPQTELTGYTDRIRELNGAALKGIIRRVYPDPNDVTIVMIGNAAAIRPVAKRYGPLVEARLEDPLIAGVRSATNRAR